MEKPMFSENISKEQQAELAIMSELIARNDTDLALAIEPSTYVVVMESETPGSDTAKHVQKSHD
jgi:hypothetical protein